MYYIISVALWSNIIIFYLYNKIRAKRSLPRMIDIRVIMVSIIISPLSLVFGIFLIPNIIITNRKLKKMNEVFENDKHEE